MEKRIIRKPGTSYANPFKKGGLGSRKMEEINRVFAMKLWCNFLKQDKLWNTFMWKKYIGALHPSQVVEKLHNSPHWKRLITGRHDS